MSGSWDDDGLVENLPTTYLKITATDISKLVNGTLEPMSVKPNFGTVEIVSDQTTETASFHYDGEYLTISYYEDNRFSMTFVREDEVSFDTLCQNWPHPIDPNFRWSPIKRNPALLTSQKKTVGK